MVGAELQRSRTPLQKSVDSFDSSIQSSNPTKVLGPYIPLGHTDVFD